MKIEKIEDARVLPGWSGEHCLFNAILLSNR
jgi:hypothetical protein